jgi:hypothetical protein
MFIDFNCVLIDVYGFIIGFGLVLLKKLFLYVENPSG